MSARCSTSCSTGCGSRRSRPAAATRAALEHAAAWVLERVRGAGGSASSCASTTATRSRSASCARADAARADGPDLRPLRRPGPGELGRLDLAAVRAADPRRPPLRARRGRRQGQLPAAPARRLRDGPSRRAAGQRARARRGRGGVRRRAVAEWVRDGRARAPTSRSSFDGGMADAATPAITVGLRGIVMLHLAVRAAERNLHSGHVWRRDAQRAARAARDARPGRARAPTGACARSCARASPRPPPPSSRRGRGCRRAPTRSPAPAGARSSRRAAPSTTSAPAPSRRSTSTRSSAASRARWCPRSPRRRCRCGSHPTRTRSGCTRCSRGCCGRRCPPAPSSRSTQHRAAPVRFDPTEPALALAARGARRACGAEPAFVRTGGTHPDRGRDGGARLPGDRRGFGLPEDAIHAPDESYALRSLEWGEAAARELYAGLASLAPRA